MLGFAPLRKPPTYGESDVGALIETLEDPDPDARSAAVRALGRTGSADSISALADAAALDPAADVRRWAVDALGRLRSAEALPFLLLFTRSDEWGIRMIALGAVRRLGDRRAIDDLKLQARTHAPWRRLSYWGTIAQLRALGR